MIGEVVVELGFADQDAVDRAIELARQSGRPTGQVLVEQGVLDHDQLARVVAERFGLDYIDLSVFDLDMGAVNLLSMGAAKRYKALPTGKGFEEINERWITKRLDSIRTKLGRAGAEAAALIPLLPEKGRFSLDVPASAIKLYRDRS